MHHVDRVIGHGVADAGVAFSARLKQRGDAGRGALLGRKALIAALALACAPLGHAGPPAGAKPVEAAPVSLPPCSAVTCTVTPSSSNLQPTGGHIVSGTGHISQSGDTTDIVQTSPDLFLSWQSFNVGSQDTVNFVQPSSSAIAVNRILGSNGSEILGHLNANGEVWLVNPNGIVFGQGAEVNVGGLIASTLDDVTLSGTTASFSGSGTGSIVNAGTINAANGGYVALLGNHVGNEGTITARLGTVALGAGSAATLTFSGAGLVRMQVNESTLSTLAENGGVIEADGGTVIMSAGAKDALLASVVNNTGVIEARTVENHNGTIELLGGMTAGTVNVGGTIDASAPEGGNGGFIETNAAHVEVANGAKVTTLAAAGKTGSWLIDPTDYTVAASGGDMSGATLSSDLNSTNTTILSSNGVSPVTGGGGGGNINVNDIVSWSANTTLTLTAANNVNVNANMTATGNTAGLVINPNTTNGSQTASGTGAFNLAMGNSITLSGLNPSLSIGGNAYTVINSLGAPGSTTGTDLQGINGNLSGYYALGSNIDATATSSWNGGAGFAPIGNSIPYFTGSFNGLGHTISNLTINRPSTGDVGLFAATNVGAVIQNVGLVGGSVSGGYATGGLVGFLYYSTVSKSYATGSVSGASTVGGLVGDNFSGVVSNSYAAGSVSGSNVVGGLVGENDSFASITDSYATASVNGTSGSEYVGGLLGNNYLGSVIYSYATGRVSGSEYVGGLVGYNEAPQGPDYSNSVIVNSYATGGVSGSSNVGGLVGFNDSANGARVSNSFWDATTSGQSTSSGGTGLTTAQMQTASNFTGFTFTTTPGASGNNWVIVDANGTLNNASSAAGATFPMLASEYSTTINNAHQLQLMAMNLAASYTLGQNVNASATGSGGDVWGSTGFIPIGDLTTYFSGSFNGLGHTISNLTINLPSASYVGLFGVTDGSLIENVGLVGGNVTGTSFVGDLVGSSGGTVSSSYATGSVSGSISGGSVGGLVGEESGTGNSITNSYATGNVSGYVDVGGLVGDTGAGIGGINNSYATGNVSGHAGVGGLVGYLTGAGITDSHATGAVTGSSGASGVGGLAGSDLAPISNSYATGSVNGGSGSLLVGGLVGDGGATISNTYATGSVSGSSYLGGLVGGGSSTVSNSYATGSVSGLSGSEYVGGLVGELPNSSAVSNSYAVGSVSGSSLVGGLVGYNGGGVPVSNSFWDTTTSGQSSSAGGRGMTTAQMQAQANFTSATSANGNVNPGWNFTNTWVMYSGDTFPLLQSFMSPLTVTANNAAITYDKQPYSGGNGVTYSTTPNGNLLGTVSYGGTSQGAINAGTYTIAPSGLYSNQQGYIISYANGTLTVNPLALTGASIAAGNSIYGAAVTPGAVSFSNVFAGDVVTAAVSIVSPLYSTSGHLSAGTYAQTASSTLSGASAEDYSFTGYTTLTNNYTVGQLALTGASIFAGNSIYGSAVTPGAVSFSNVIAGDLVNASASIVGPTYSTSHNLSAGSYAQSASTLSGADASDYSFAGYTTLTNNYTVNPLALTGAAIAAGNSTYGSSVTPGAVSFGNVISGDLVSSTASIASPIYSTSNHLNAGSYAQSASDLTGADAGDYSFGGYTTPTANYTVNPLALTGAAIASASSTYASIVTPGAVTFGNVIAGDLVSSAASIVSPVYSTSNHLNAGSYAQTASALTGADAGDYTFTGYTTSSNNYTVNPLALTGASIAAASSIYGSSVTPGTVSFGNAIAGDDVSATASLVSPTYSTSSHVNAGSYAQTASALTGADAGDYSFTGYTTPTNTYTVNPLALTGTAIASASSTYGSTVNPGAVTFGNAIAGDDVSATASLVSPTYSTSNHLNAGSYAQSASALTGADASDYSFTGYTTPTNTYTVNPLALTGTAIASASSTYGSTVNPGAVTFGNAIAGDDVSATASLVSPTYSTSNHLNAGSYAQSASALTGADASDYSFTGYTTPTNTYTVNPLALTGTAIASASSTYGSTVTPGAVNFGNAIAGDDVGATASLVSATYSTSSHVNAGSYAQTASALTGTDAGNYTFSGYTTPTNNYTVNPFALTVTATGVNRTYDGLTDASVTLSDDRFAGDLLTDSYTSASFGNGNAGTGRKVNVAGISVTGTDAGNYTWNTTATTTANISRAALTITADPATETYSGLGYSGDSSSVTYTGFVDNQTSSVLGGALGYSGNSQGATNAGSYTIRPEGLTSPNYAITFATGKLTITKAPLTVAANGFTETYNGLAYSGGNGATYTGFVDGQSSSVLGGALGYAGTSQGATNAGTYVIRPKGLTSPNYAITFTNGTLTINKAPLTITADSGSVPFTGTPFSGGFGVTYSGFVDGQTASVLSGTLSYAGTSQGATAAGTYGIRPEDLTSSNYLITWVNGKLTIQ